MLCPPLLHPLHILGAAEVIPVLGPAQPTLLAGVFADDLALGGETIFLAPAVTVVGHEELLTVQAFAASGRWVHRVAKSPG